MLPSNFVFLSAAFILLGDIGYLRDTIRGRVKPNRVTWFLWGFAPLIAFFAQYSQGVGISSIFTFTFALLPLFILLASFLNKKSVWKLTKFDYLCGAFSLIGIALWAITKNPNTAILFSIIADFFAAIPTYKKSYTNPETETYKVYILNGLAGITTLLTIKNWEFSNAAFPAYVFLLNVFFIFVIRMGLTKKSKN